jgi:hypothetical protein
MLIKYKICQVKNHKWSEKKITFYGKGLLLQAVTNPWPQQIVGDVSSRTARTQMGGRPGEEP